MPTPALDIRGSGHSFTIVHDGRTLPRHFPNRNAAWLALLAHQRRIAPRQSLACLCCATRFTSTGKANRLCHQCKKDYA